MNLVAVTFFSLTSRAVERKMKRGVEGATNEWKEKRKKISKRISLHFACSFNWNSCFRHLLCVYCVGTTGGQSCSLCLLCVYGRLKRICVTEFSSSYKYLWLREALLFCYTWKNETTKSATQVKIHITLASLWMWMGITVVLSFSLYSHTYTWVTLINLNVTSGVNHCSTIFSLDSRAQLGALCATWVEREEEEERASSSMDIALSHLVSLCSE